MAEQLLEASGGSNAAGESRDSFLPEQTLRGLKSGLLYDAICLALRVHAQSRSSRKPLFFGAGVFLFPSVTSSVVN